MTEKTEDGRQFKLFVVLNEFTRESLAIEVGRSFTSQGVILTLQYLFAVRGAPEHIRSDNGPKFIAKSVQNWLRRAVVNTLYINKAIPWENGYVESFNGKLRDELLNRELFLSLADTSSILREAQRSRRPSRRGVLGDVAGRSAGRGYAPPSGSAGPINPDSLTKTGTKNLRGPMGHGEFVWTAVLS